MARNVYIIIHHSPLFPAHWALWIPNVTDATTGKVINVRGDPLSGFDHVFERNASLEDVGGKYSLILLASIEDRYVSDMPSDEAYSSDKIANDYLEEIALTIPAPQKSLRSYIDQVNILLLQICTPE